MRKKVESNTLENAVSWRRKHSDQISFRSKVKQIKGHSDQLLKRSNIKKINFQKFKDQKDQRSTKFKGQRSKRIELRSRVQLSKSSKVKSSFWPKFNKNRGWSNSSFKLDNHGNFESISKDFTTKYCYGTWPLKGPPALPPVSGNVALPNENSFCIVNDLISNNRLGLYINRNAFS